ncbi:MAG: hypothetical protein N3G21_02165 [Candidatus Hydrogenedentes bacterium]|nr:hypothetical protein [Candidatus Hydrogenedentota bacterium]
MQGERKDSIELIQQEISEIEKSIEYYKKALQKTYDLLEKADEKLKEDKANYNHWLGVIENLEKSLIEIRGVLQGKETRLSELKRKYCELSNTMRREDRKESLSEGEGDILNGAEIVSINVARELLSVPSEKLSQLTLSEISQILDEMKVEESTNTGSVEEQISGEKINKQSELKEQFRFLLTSALKKIWNNKPAELTTEERSVLLKAFHSLDKKRRRTPQEDRLHRVMSAMVKIAFQNFKPR